MFTITDLEQLQTEHPEWQMELVDGSMLVMGPSDYESEEIISEFARLLANWVRPQRLGRVTGSSAGFILPSLGFKRKGTQRETQRNAEFSLRLMQPRTANFF
jgi:Uma2 family endonuclease